MHNASTSAGCAETRKSHKTGLFIHFSETGDLPDTLIFYFQHNMIARSSQWILIIDDSHPAKPETDHDDVVSVFDGGHEIFK